MNERDLEKACTSEIERQCYNALTWKIHDEVTGGQPDLEVAWNGHTTKLEFKLIREKEAEGDLHKKWEDGRQLATLIRYEQMTGRAWLVVYQVHNARKKWHETRIYRPLKLLREQVPQAEKVFDGLGPGNLIDLWQRGVIRLSGLNHGGVATLIRLTHS